MGILACIVLFLIDILLAIVVIVLALGPSRRRSAPEAPELPAVLFHPSAQEGKEPEGFEVVETPVDGGMIKSHLFRNSDADKDEVVVFFHGNGEVAEHWFPYAREIAGAFKANLLLVDYRGYGLSTGVPTYWNMLSDAEAVFQMLRKDGLSSGEGRAPRTFSRIHLFGRSIGSVPAIHLAWKFNGRTSCMMVARDLSYARAVWNDEVASLVIDSGFAHLPALIERLGRGNVPPPKLPNGFLDNVDKLRNIHIPTLFLHGVEDSLIPIEAARENFGASTADFKKLEEIEGAGHNSTVLSSGYFDKIRDFLDHC